MRVLSADQVRLDLDQRQPGQSIDQSPCVASTSYQNVSFSRHQLHRRQRLAVLINRFVVQLQTGCGNPQCVTPTCYTCKSRILPHQSRQYTTVTARAMAVELATSTDPDRYMCPYVLNAHIARLSTECQQKTDPKSIVQRLFNTKAFRDLQSANTLLGEPPDDHIPRSEVARLTCAGMIAMKAHSADPESMFNGLSSFGNLSSSFHDHPLGIWTPTKQHDLPSVRLDQALRGWPSSLQILIFDSMWLALDPLFESTFPHSNQHMRDNVTLPSSLGLESVANAVITTIHALTASIPRAQRDTWHVVWSTVVNGRAYGKQRFRKSDIYSSPWLHILDAFESEPALRLTQRLIQAVAARSCLEETNLTEDTEVRVSGHKSETPHRIRMMILKSLIKEEREVRMVKYGSYVRSEKPHGKSLLGTTTLLWLEWLRKCFLKHWDGTFRISRWGIAGAALEMMEDIWNHRNIYDLDLPDDLFPTPVVFNNFNIDKAAVDWVEYKQKPHSRHILSFRFLFSTRSLTLLFRMVNHIFMRRAYCGAGAIQKMRGKAMARASQRDAAYLDLRIKATQEPYLVLKINRHSVLSDANDQIWHRLRSELAKPLRVRMGIDEGEIGHDLGGVQIEFFKLACCEALDPNYSLFSIDPQTHLAWFQPASMVPLYKFQLFGVLFALAIYNGVTLPVSFPLVFYRKLLAQPYKDSDLSDGWPGLAKALQDLCAYNGSVEDDLARDFTFSFTANGLYVEVDMHSPWQESIDDNAASSLVEAGQMKVVHLYPIRHHPERDIRNNAQRNVEEAESSATQPSQPQPSASADTSTHDVKAFKWPGWEVNLADESETPAAVTNANREEYVQEYKRWLLDYSIRPQFESFFQGFHTVLDSKALKLLTPETLRTLVEGHKHLDISLLQRAATYRGYDTKSQIIRWFWETVRGYAEDKQKQLLEFVTASSRVPINGAESLTFVIEKMTGDTLSLPGSSTCFSTLRLPEYETKEILQQKLDIALQHSVGFGQA